MGYRRFIKWWVLVPIVLVVLAAVFFLLQRRSADTTPGTDTPAIEVQRFSSGGIAGRGDGKEVVIRIGQVVINDESRVLTSAETNAIIDKMRKANFFELNDSYVCEGCADQFSTTLSMQYGDQKHMVTFDDGSDAPAALVELDQYLVGLAP